MKWEIGKGKGMIKGKSLGSDVRGTRGSSPRHEGKGKGGFDEQRRWDDWWAMKEFGGDDLDVADSGQRSRQEEWGVKG